MRRLFLFLTIVPSILFAFSGGDGTSGSPFQIATPAQLDSLRLYCDSADSGTYFLLMNDINLTTWLSPGNPGYNDGAFWLPIGDSVNRFYGNFNGNYHQITGLKINRPDADYVGLFGFIHSLRAFGGRILNTGLETSAGDTIKGRNYVGGLAGAVDGARYCPGALRDCYTVATVTGGSQVGGLAGRIGNGVVANCYAAGPVSGTGNAIGGLLGWLDDGQVSCGYSVGSVSGGTSTGGLIGYTYTGIIGGYWDKQTSGQSASSGLRPSSGKTTAEMKTQSTFGNWNFNTIWAISEDVNNGYPYLQWQFLAGVKNVDPGGMIFINHVSLYCKNGFLFFSNPISANAVFTLFNLNGQVIYRSVIHGTLAIPPFLSHRVLLWRIEHPKMVSSGSVLIKQ